MYRQEMTSPPYNHPSQPFSLVNHLDLDDEFDPLWGQPFSAQGSDGPSIGS